MMKNTIAFLLLFVTGALSTTHAQTTPVKVIAHDAFISIKMHKEMLGGDIEVRDSAGHVVSVYKIDHCKIYLDLFEFADGTYNVSVHHNDVVLEFSYRIESPQIHAKKKHGTHNGRHV